MWMKLSEEKFAPVPLTAVSVKVSVINLVAEVQVEQSYRNEAPHPIKVVYKFPLNEGIYPILFMLLTCIYLMLFTIRSRFVQVQRRNQWTRDHE